MAEQQKALLGEMFGSLQSSVEAVRSLMSLLLVEFIGWETVALFCVSWLVVLLLPQFNYSRFKMVMVLLGEVAVEVCVRRLYGYIVMGRETPPPNLVGGIYSDGSTLEEDGHASGDSFGMQLFWNLLEPLRTA